MAIRALTLTKETLDTFLATWTGLNTGDEGAPAELIDFADRTIQVFGTFGGASVALHGSNDGVNYAVLADQQGVAIAITAAGIKAVGPLTKFIKPVVTGGAGVGITVLVLARRP